MAEPPRTVTTVREAATALVPYAPVTLDIACARLGLRCLRVLDPETLLEAEERACMGRLLSLLHAATDGTGEGYVGVLWAMGRSASLAGITPIEACRTETDALDARAALRREQDRLFER